MAVQDYKINYKSDFVLTINGDAGWAVPFCIKFWTGMPSQAYFVGFDGVKYVNCKVGDTPTQLLVMFDDHHLPIGPLRMQIAYHTTIEEFPGSVFDEVTNARDVIVTIDGTDYQVMLDFTGEDAPELEFDLPAYANEAERIQNELQRQQNEADRIAAELQREQATAAAVQGAENVNAQLNGTTLTVTNRQGVSTSVNTKGEQGEQGPEGPQGETGETGPRGTSIVSFTPKSTTATTLIYTVTFSDGTTQDVAIPKGAKGDTGATGPQGPQGDTGVSITAFTYASETETEMLYTVTFSDGTTQQVSIPKGAKGDTGPQGPVGPQGPQGPMGDVAVITPEQQAAFTMYSTTGQNTNGPMTQKAVTDALVEKDALSFEIKGAGNTYVETSDYNQFVKVGNTYRLWVVNPDVSMAGITGLANTACRLAVDFYQADKTLIEERKLTYWKQPLADYYDIIIPDGCAYITIGGRCASGSVLKLALEDTTLISNYAIIEGKAVVAQNSGTYHVGDLIQWNSRCCTDYIDVSTMSSIIFTNVRTNSGSKFAGLVFYDSEKTAISSKLQVNDSNVITEGYIIERISVPSDAAYVRFSFYRDKKYGKFFFADGDKDAAAISLWSAESYRNVWFQRVVVDSTNGIQVDSTKRITSYYIPHSGTLTFSVADGYVIRSVNYYTKDKVWYKGKVYKTQSVVTEQQEEWGYVRIVVNNIDDTTEITLSSPINLKVNSYSGTNNDLLKIGTFNSSFNLEDTEDIREKFCGLINGTDKIETFMLFSDPHLSANSRYENVTEGVRDKYISTMQKYYNSMPLDNCICAGDLLNYHDTNAEGLDELGYYDGYMRKLFRNYRPCMGNHDTAPYNTSHNYRNTTLVHNDVRNSLFREEKNTYYSFDGINTKFYVLNSGSSYIKTMTSTSEPTINNIRWTQIDWYANKLLTDDADYSIIIMHMYSNGTPLTWYNESTAKASAGIFPFSKHIREVAIAYNNRVSITKNGITYDFSSCTGKVMLFICGHSHFDFIDDSMELPVVCITNLEGGVWDATNEQITYSLIPTFDCCMMDIDNSALYMTRVGAGSSRIVNCTKQDVSAGSSITLTSKLSGTVTWQTRNSSIATVSNGTVAGVASGCTGIIATNENSEEEYWIVKVG